MPVGDVVVFRALGRETLFLLFLFEALEEKQLQPDIIVYGGVISACAKAGGLLLRHFWGNLSNHEPLGHVGSLAVGC